MAEFLTEHDADSKYGSKSKTNAGLTLGIIGTALAATNGNNGNGILGNLFGGNNRLSNEVQVLTNQIWAGRVQDLDEKCKMYVDVLTRDNMQNMRLCDELYKRRELDIQEKADIFTRLNSRLVELEKKDAAISASLPLMFELNKVNAEKYTDACCCKTSKDILMVDAHLQRQLDHKIDGQLKYSYNDLCAPVPSIAPLYCSPFTKYGTGAYVGQAASNYNAANEAFNSSCPSCMAQ